MDTLIILAAVFSVLSTLYFFGRMAVASLRRWRSEKWPWTTSSITANRISVVSSGRGGSMYQLSVTYSYAVEGTTYTGGYSELCASQSAAEGSLRSLQDMPPPVRYKPGKPRVSAMDPYRDAGLVFQHPPSGA